MACGIVFFEAGLVRGASGFVATVDLGGSCNATAVGAAFSLATVAMGFALRGRTQDTFPCGGVTTCVCQEVAFGRAGGGSRVAEGNCFFAIVGISEFHAGLLATISVSFALLRSGANPRRSVGFEAGFALGATRFVATEGLSRGERIANALDARLSLGAVAVGLATGYTFAALGGGIALAVGCFALCATNSCIAADWDGFGAGGAGLATDDFAAFCIRTADVVFALAGLSVGLDTFGSSGASGLVTTINGGVLRRCTGLRGSLGLGGSRRRFCTGLPE